MWCRKCLMKLIKWCNFIPRTVWNWKIYSCNSSVVASVSCFGGNICLLPLHHGNRTELWHFVNHKPCNCYPRVQMYWLPPYKDRNIACFYAQRQMCVLLVLCRDVGTSSLPCVVSSSTAFIREEVGWLISAWIIIMCLLYMQYMSSVKTWWIMETSE